MKNNSGSLYIVLLPLILTVMLVAATAVYIYSYHYKTQSSCQHHLLRSQELMAEALTQLLSLNGQASTLRTQERTARAEMAATVAAPPAHAVARLRFLTIRLKQAQLHLKQKTIITEGQLKATLETSKLKIEFRKYSAIFSRAKNIKLNVDSPKLAIRATPASSLAPNYSTSVRFSQTQKLTASWTAPLKNLLPKALLPVFRGVEAFNLQCSATIEKKGSKWQSLLSRAKS